MIRSSAHKQPQTARQAFYSSFEDQGSPEPVKAPSGLSVAQQRAVAGGLHPSSIGGSYPFHPVYRDNGDDGWWEVHNLQTGKIITYDDLGPVHFTAQGAINEAADQSEGRGLPQRLWK